MGILDFMKKINLATRGQDPTAAMFTGLAGLGLNVKAQQGAMVQLEGAFQGKEAEMFVDGSGVMQAGNNAMMGGALSMGLSAIGAEWMSRRAYYRSHNRMQFAKMVVEWRLKASRQIPDGLSIGRESSVGASIGNKVFSNITSPAFERPGIKSWLESGNFDEITSRDGWVQAYWSPEMRVYQKISASPEKFTEANRTVLEMLARLCDSL